MLTDAQIRVRRTGLSATDMARLSGENPYGGPIDVYADKLRSEVEALERSAAPDSRSLTGQMLEAAIAKRYLYDATPQGQELRVLQTATTYRHPEVEWALATPDRFIFNRREGDRISRATLVQQLKSGKKADWLLECKLVGSRLSKHWNIQEWSDEPDCDRIPPYVYVQVQWQMFVLGYDRVDVAAILYGTTFKHFVIKRDEEYIKALRDIGEQFWVRNVLGKIPPPPDGSDGYAAYLERMYPRAVKALLPAPEGSVEIATEYRQAVEAEAKAKKEKERLGQCLRALVRDAVGIEGPWGRVTLLTRDGAVDWVSLAKDVGITEDVIERYRRGASRSLKVSVTCKPEEVF